MKGDSWMGSPYILWEMQGNTLIGGGRMSNLSNGSSSKFNPSISNSLSKPIFLSNLDSKSTKSSSNSFSI